MRPFLFAGALLLFAAGAHAAIPSSERNALVSIYDATGGPSWTHRDNWLGAPGTECTWYGVTCGEGDTRVIYLELYENNLQGSLPAGIAGLSHLLSLQIYGNALFGELPPQIGQLPELRSLYAENNAFSGEIPAQIGDLKTLEVLYLDANGFTGPIPSTLGSLPLLSELGLSTNQLSGAIPPQLANASSLTALTLTGNRLTGTIPPQLGSLRNLIHLGLGDNQLEGSVPGELGDAVSLVTLNLAYNELTGEIPSGLSRLHALEELYLNNNQLTGTVPDSFRDLVSLKQLELTSNQLSGEIPAALFAIPSLVELEAGDNDFSGELPRTVGSLANLEVLSLYANALSGTIPEELGSLAKLRILELEANDLTGAIPARLGQLPSLVWLDLSGNALTGAIPRELGSLPALEGLSLYDNELTGTIPPELGQILSLRVLYLADNHLVGTIPDALRPLTKLQQFSVNGNRLTGTIPTWIGEWTLLTELFLGENELTGTLPAGLANLENLWYLDLSENELTGSLFDFTKLTQLVYLRVEFNSLSGPLPPSIGALRNLEFAEFNDNAFTGALPAEIATLDKIDFLSMSNNAFEGPIPAAIGQLETLTVLSLWGNRFTGTIPKEIGNLTSLRFLDLSFNALRGPIPHEIVNLTNLEAASSDFAYNALYSNDPAVDAFVNEKQYDGAYQVTQTVVPRDLRVTATTDRSATLTWTPIDYLYDEGGYQVVASTTPGGAAVAVATTQDKSTDSITVRNLAPATTYFFTVAAVTHPHWGQKNLIVSDASAATQASTGARVVAPAEVVLTDPANGMVQVDGVAVGTDSFTVTNFGDVGTTLELEQGGDFFTFAPHSFQLAAGASQVVTLTPTPQAPGTYYGHVVIRGAGAADDLIAYVVLLATSRPAGTVIAEPIATTIELAGVAGSDSIGTAQFRNRGTAPLTGIIVSDQPWVEVPAETITIDPGSIGSVNFRVVRSKRPQGAEGALTANLSLIYVNGSAGASAVSVLSTSTPVSVSIVTVVDVTKPSVTPAGVPPLAPGEVPFFVPGISVDGARRSDLSIVNASAFRPISDLRLYFTRQSQTTVASLQPLGFAQSVNLVNLVGNVYSTAGSGTLQIRSTSSSNIASSAKATAVTDEGTFTGALPVFRGDRSASPGQRVYLTGLAAGGDIVVQETGGTAGSVQIDFLDASGSSVGARTENIEASGLIELRNAIPANAVTAIVTAGGSAVIAPYARLTDAAGDTWSVVDWSRFYRYERTEQVRVPFANGRQEQAGGRRRAVRNADSGSHRTDIALFNPGDAETRATVRTVESSGRTSERTVVLPPRGTSILRDAGSASGSPVANILVSPGRGELVVTARSGGAKGGSAIPVLSATSGLRLGQSDVFSGLDDTAATRTGYGFVESGGAQVRVRAQITIDDSTALATAVTSRTFDLRAGEQLFLPEIVRSFAGDSRADLYGDLHGLVLEVEVIGGGGAIVPFVIATDTESGDTSVIVH